MRYVRSRYLEHQCYNNFKIVFKAIYKRFKTLWSKVVLRYHLTGDVRSAWSNEALRHTKIKLWITLLFIARSAKKKHITTIIVIFLLAVGLLHSCAVSVQTTKSYILLPRRMTTDSLSRKSKISSDRQNPKKEDLKKCSPRQGDKHLLKPKAPNLRQI